MSHEIYPMTDELLVKFMLDECNSIEIAEVNNWLNQHIENQEYYQAFKRVWEESKLLEPTMSIDIDESWIRMKSKIEKPKPQFTVSRKYYYIAASVLIILGLFTLFNYINKQPSSEKPQFVIEQKLIETQKETRIDTLSDRSIVTLNKNARLKYPTTFSEKERRVELKGEAFFSITPNKEKPFFIDASNDVEIRVVGTSFNVKSFDAYTEVVVETGIVEVRKFNRVILLHPNERARIDKEDSTITVQKTKDKLYKYYRSKEFECDNTPLWKVVEVLNEAYADSIIIGRSELKSLTLTTRFDNESLENILDIISETFEIKIEKKGNKYILK